jgi:hypothetical protein
LRDSEVQARSGALPPDEQALRVHLPEIERIRGKEAAAAIRIKLATQCQ